MVIRMKIAGIIAEYNPFHSGHLYHIRQTRRAGYTHIAVVMSGNFTQRGEPALLPKRERCAMALACGADLILELPAAWAVSSAQQFAAGGVSVLDALGCVEALSFGSETGDLAALRCEAELLETLEGSAELRTQLGSGVSYPTALENAARSLTGTAPAPRDRPNDILAREYLRALRRSAMRPLAVLRQGARHDGEKAERGSASASHIRALITQGHVRQALACMPQASAHLLDTALREGCAPVDLQLYERLVLSRLRSMDTAALRALPDVAEGLENRLLAAAREATGLPEFYALVKSKRYTLARIRRIAAAAFLGIPAGMSASPVPYLRVLGFNGRGLEILRAAGHTARLPVVSRHAEMAPLGDFARTVYRLECRVSDQYALCLPRAQQGGREQKWSPVRGGDA